MFRLGDLKSRVLVPAFLLISATLPLACCANQQHLDSQAKEDKETAAATTNMMAGMDDAKCRAYGYQPSSPRYFQCRDRFDAERKQAGLDDVAQNPSK
jgi:hypothetical protein